MWDFVMTTVTTTTTTTTQKVPQDNLQDTKTAKFIKWRMNAEAEHSV